MKKILMPNALTAENGAKGLMIGEFKEFAGEVQCPECDGYGGECEACHGSGEVDIYANISWTTIKQIYAKAVDHFSEDIQEPDWESIARGMVEAVEFFRSTQSGYAGSMVQPVDRKQCADAEHVLTMLVRKLKAMLPEGGEKN